MLSSAKWGAIVGAAIYILSQLITVVGDAIFGAAPADPGHPGKIALGCLNLLLIAFSFSAAGYYTGRETRVAGYGAVAGMVAFAVYGLLLALIPIGAQIQLGQGAATLGQRVIITLFVVVFYLAIGALIGWLGGRPGAAQGQARARRESEQTK